MASKPKLKNQIKKVNYSGLDLIRLTTRQEEFYKMIRNSEVSFGTGAAGTAKTFVACYTALRLLSEGKIKKIILTKPVQESGEKLGFLPGDIDEKIGPYMESFLLSIQKMIGEDAAEFLLEHGIIEMRPLAYMRGATFDDCLVEGEYILTENGEMKVEDIFELLEDDISYSVYSYNFENDCIELKELDSMSCTEVNNFYEIEMEDGIINKVSPGHKFYVKDKGWVRADELLDTDVIFYDELQDI